MDGDSNETHTGDICYKLQTLGSGDKSLELEVVDDVNKNNTLDRI